MRCAAKFFLSVETTNGSLSMGGLSSNKRGRHQLSDKADVFPF
jgi:hypothetical protein